MVRDRRRWGRTPRAERCGRHRGRAGAGRTPGPAGAFGGRVACRHLGLGLWPPGL